MTFVIPGWVMISSGCPTLASPIIPVRAAAPVVACLDGVSKNYGEVKALQNVDFAVHA